MLDVIVTISKDTPPDYVNTCLAPVRNATLLADYPINIFEEPGVPGNIGAAMANGFARTTSKYVMWVDDDDFLLPNAFTAFADDLNHNFAALFAREVMILANGRLVPRDMRHHPAVFRRDVIERVNLATYRAVPNMKLHDIADSVGNTVDIMQWVYMHRIRKSGGSALRSQYGAEEAAR